MSELLSSNEMAPGLTTKLQEARGKLDVFQIEIREAQKEDRERQLKREHEETERRREDEKRREFAKQEERDKGDLENLRRRFSATDNTNHGKASCVSGTRLVVLEKLSAWAQTNPSDAQVDPSAPKLPRLLWLYGVAGSGKSAIAASTSQTLVKAGCLAGSFFCQRDVEHQRNPFRLFEHFSYCLAAVCPVFRRAVMQYLDDYDRMGNPTLGSFVKHALIDPLLTTGDGDVPRVVFVIDALDECNNNGVVAGHIAKVVSSVPWIKLIVASRNQPQIQRAFEGPLTTMHDLAQEDVKSDIRIYLEHRIEEDGLIVLTKYAEDLVERADGLFIWIYTILELMKNLLDAKKEELVKKILSGQFIGNHGGRLAGTYLLVLEEATKGDEDKRKVVRWIVGLLRVTADRTPLPVSGLYAFLPPEMLKLVNLSEFLAIVRKLQPVLKLGTGVEFKIDSRLSDDSIVRAYHASFLDLIENENLSTSETRINVFWTDPVHLHRNMAMGCLEIMVKGTRLVKPDEDAQSRLGFNICKLETSHQTNSEIKNLKERVDRYTTPALRYGSVHWMAHLTEAHVDVDKLGGDACYGFNLESLSQLLNGFLHSERSLFWLELLSLMGNLDVGRTALINIIKQAGSPVSSLSGANLYQFIVSAGTRAPRPGRVRDAKVD